eukprot:6656469-Lingulodinium_polyedra.AAC.1
MRMISSSAHTRSANDWLNAALYGQPPPAMHAAATPIHADHPAATSTRRVNLQTERVVERPLGNPLH